MFLFSESMLKGFKQDT